MTMGAFAVIFDDHSRVLLCHRSDIDAWNLPGGRVEEGEAPWDAAVRETREEVGLIVEIDRLAGIYFKPEQSEVVFSFVCRITGGKLTTSEEADDVRYFILDEMPPNTLPKQVERIRDAAEGRLIPVLKEQHGPTTRERMGRGDWPPREEG